MARLAIYEIGIKVLDAEDFDAGAMSYAHAGAGSKMLEARRRHGRVRFTAYQET